MEHLRSNTSSEDSSAPAACVTEGCPNQAASWQVADRVWNSALCAECRTKRDTQIKADEDREELKQCTERLALPPRFQQATFETFKRDNQPTAYDAALSFAEQYAKNTKPRGLFLFGKAGSGKTHLVAAIGNKLVRMPGVRFVTAPELLLTIKKTFESTPADDPLDRISYSKLLIIDDLGSEKPTEWVQETLFVLIDRRYTHYLPTIITSNYSLDQLKDRLSYRLASRIAEMSSMVELRPTDYRVTNQS